MDPSFITFHYVPLKSLTLLFRMTQKFPWNSDSFCFLLISQFSYCPHGRNFLESKKVDNMAHSFFRDSQFESSVFLFDLTIFPNRFFNAFLMRLVCCILWPSWPCLVTQAYFLHFFLLKIACIQQWMSMGGIFSAVKHLITAHCLNRTSSWPSILTGTVLELRITVCSRLCMMEGRYHVTAWNQFYVAFFALLKNVAAKARLFSSSLYFRYQFLTWHTCFLCSLLSPMGQHIDGGPLGISITIFEDYVLSLGGNFRLTCRGHWKTKSTWYGLTNIP